MMSPDNNIAAQPASKDHERQSSGGGGGGSRKISSMRPPDQQQALKCPRCDSPNTKFCYYNNYSLTQPRHFCKTCRRYWTKGGALRSVPIGGGCRKNKKVLKSSSSSSRFSGDSSSKDSSLDIGGGLGLKFFNGLSPAMDFQLGGLSFPPPRLHHNSSNITTGTTVYNTNQFSSSFGETSSITPCFNLDPMLGFNFPLSTSHLLKQGDHNNQSGTGLSGPGGAFQEMGSLNNTSSLASSIESLSCINQDLHWKLQQQRLGMLFGGGEISQKESSNTVSTIPLLENDHHHAQKPQPILFQNLEISSKPQQSHMGGNSRKDSGGSGTLATEWFFDNSYAPVNVNSTIQSNSNSTGNENGSNWNGFQAWNNLNQYSALP